MFYGKYTNYLALEIPTDTPNARTGGNARTYVTICSFHAGVAEKRPIRDINGVQVIGAPTHEITTHRAPLLTGGTDILLENNYYFLVSGSLNGRSVSEPRSRWFRATASDVAAFLTATQVVSDLPTGKMTSDLYLSEAHGARRRWKILETTETETELKMNCRLES